MLVEDFFSAAPFAAEKADQRLRLWMQGHAQRFFVFLILSLLLEKRAGADPGDHALAESLKGLFAAELVETRKTAKSLLGSAPEGDPFEPYYDSFARGAKDPAQSPFAVFARQLCEKTSPQRRSAAAPPTTAYSRFRRPTPTSSPRARLGARLGLRLAAFAAERLDRGPLIMAAA